LLLAMRNGCSRLSGTVDYRPVGVNKVKRYISAEQEI
jgi:hypothetical protein